MNVFYSLSLIPLSAGGEAGTEITVFIQTWSGLKNTVAIRK
jgi:hypothetical protein